MKSKAKQIRLRFLFDSFSGATPKSNVSEYWDGEIPWITPKDLGRLEGKQLDSTQRKLTVKGYESCGTRLADVGSLVLSKRAPIGQVAILAIKASCNQGCFLLSPGKQINERFYYYCLIHLRAYLEMLGRGSTFMELSSDDLRSVQLPFFAVKTQTIIANFLDEEIEHLDALVTEKNHMLSLIEEKRSAQINHVVTRGLNPDVPLKQSGHSWLGEIPAHWAMRRCATLFTNIDVRGASELPLLHVSLNTGVTLRKFSNDRIESVAKNFNTYKIARTNQLVFNKMRFWQGAAGIAPEDGLVSPDYTVAQISHELSPNYIELLFRLPTFSQEVHRYSYGMVDDRLRLYWIGFKNINIPVPPKKEQEEIVGYLYNERDGTSELESELKKSIILLKERRSALITAAVTGQLKPEDMQI